MHKAWITRPLPRFALAAALAIGGVQAHAASQRYVASPPFKDLLTISEAIAPGTPPQFTARLGPVVVNGVGTIDVGAASEVPAGFNVAPVAAMPVPTSAFIPDTLVCTSDASNSGLLGFPWTTGTSTTSFTNYTDFANSQFGAAASGGGSGISYGYNYNTGSCPSANTDFGQCLGSPSGFVDPTTYSAYPACVDQPAYLDMGLVQQAANQWAASAAAQQFGQAVAAYMRQNGIGTAMLAFTQTLQVPPPPAGFASTVPSGTIDPGTASGTAPSSPGTQTVSVTYSMSIDQNGRVLAAAPTVANANSTTLQVQYTPYQVVSPFPADWGYANAGELRYRLLDANNNALTTWTTIQTDGAFDSAYGSASSANQVQCLLQRSKGTGCSGPTDVAQLLRQTGASQATVTYLYQVQPNYVPTGGGASVPVLAESVDTRSLQCSATKSATGSGCDLSCSQFNNTGIVGAVLEENSLSITTSGFDSTGALQSVQTTNPPVYVVSPIDAYANFVPISGPPDNALDPNFIDVLPLTGPGVLDTIASFNSANPGILQYVAGLQVPTASLVPDPTDPTGKKTVCQVNLPPASSIPSIGTAAGMSSYLASLPQ